MPIKINTAKGEGPKLARKYGVSALPALIVVDSQGEEIDRFLGFRKPADFIAELKPFLSGDSYGAYKKRLAKNPNDFEAALGLGRRYETRRNLAEAGKLFRRIANSETASEDFRAQAEGRLVLLRFFEDPTQDIEPLKEYFNKNVESDRAVDHAMYSIQASMGRQDTPTVVKTAEYLLKHGQAENPRLLNAYAWYLSVEGVQLDRALELAKKAVELSPEDGMILDTLAEAYAKNGMPEEAVKAAEQAVKHAVRGQQRRELEGRLAKFKEALAEKE